MSLRIVYTSAAAEKPRLTQDLAQWMDIHVAFTWRTRARLYRMIAIRLRQKSELERIMLLYIRQQERRKKTSVPRILNKVLHRMAAQGMSFAEALRPFIPHDEYMMILSGEKGDDIASAMDLLCDIKTRVGRIMRAARSAIGQPLMYVGIIFAFLYTIAKMVIPSLLMNGGMKMKASTSQDMLVFASSLATGLNGVLILSGLVGALILLWLSLTKLTGPLRVFLERAAPWSIYRNIQGYIWISSFIALVRAGMTDTEALTHQMQVATPWLRERLEAILDRLGPRGMSLPEAMEDSGFAFPSPEVIDDIEASWGGAGAYDRLLQSSRAWADEIEFTTLEQAAAAKGFANAMMMLIAGALIVASNNIGSGMSDIGPM
ncbi:type II secretion system F family protein [Gluconobacter sp. NFX36]|uniref:type II secretion system F family protein n=1 Tax=Gluconobacter sp. NFX36 TaxID=2819535 RepID=UPI003B8EE41E